MPQGIDMRRFPRANYRCEVTVFQKGKKEEFSAQTENIAAGGICLAAKGPLNKFAVVKLILYFEKDALPVECNGRVIWSVKRKDEFDIGIQFLDIKEKDALAIEKIVQECLKTSS